MASLTETAYYGRKTVNWIILSIIGYFILKLLWGIFVALFLVLFPPKAPPPNHKFGILPKLRFPAVASPSAQLVFRLETIEGGVPKASDSATVFFQPKSAPNIMALPNAKKFAQKLQINSEPLPDYNNKNIYLFVDPEIPARTLRYDLVSNNLILQYDYARDLSIFGETNIPDTDTAKTESKTLLQTLGLMPSDYSKGNIIVTYMKIVNDQLVPTTSQSQSNAVRISFFREPIRSMKTITATPNVGTIEVILSGSRQTKKRLLQLAYTYWPIDLETSATYKLKASTQAWAELQNGMGFIGVYPANNIITVREVYLAYYDSYDPQIYLQPVFVFKGDDDFMGLVPAVAPPWTE